MSEVETTGQRCQNGNEAVAGAASEAFARRLHRRRQGLDLQHLHGISLSVKLQLAGMHIVSQRGILLIVQSSTEMTS